jgi:hypothetical protein
MRRALACGALVFAFVACGDSAPTSAEAKSCLEEAGFDTGETPGIISLTAEGEEVEIADQFMAIRGADEFAIWFFGPDADAAAAADALDSLFSSGGGTRLFEQPRVNGQIALAEGVEASADAGTEVRGCLGF